MAPTRRFAFTGLNNEGPAPLMSGALPCDASLRHGDKIERSE